MLTVLLDKKYAICLLLGMYLKTFLKQEKEKRGLTHKEFAESARMSKGYLQQILSGKRRPSLSISYAIQKATNNKVKYVDHVAYYESFPENKEKIHARNEQVNKFA